MPLTASEPMSPPGNRSGFTTNESVVKTSRFAPTLSSALSLRRLRMGFESAGRKTLRTKSAVSRPPLPWPRTIEIILARRRWALQRSRMGRRAATDRSFRLRCRGRESAGAKICGASAFGGNHRCAERMIGRARPTERRTLRRFEQTAQDLSRAAFGRLDRGFVDQVEAAHRIVGSVAIAQGEGAFRQHIESAPSPINGREDFRHQRLRRDIARWPHRADVLVLEFGAARLELR